MSVTFREILNQKSWDSYEEYIAEGISQYTNELSNDISQGRKHKKKIREFIEKHFEIKKIPADLSVEKNFLAHGEVVGIDDSNA